MKNYFPFRNLDSVIGNLTKNFAEGTEYFKVIIVQTYFD